MTETKPVVLGQVSGLFGVRGWVKIHSYTEPREAILEYPDWLIGNEEEWCAIECAEGKPHGKTLVARFEGVEDRDDAAAYVNALIAIERSGLPATKRDQYYWSDLEGLRVVRETGDEMGTVAYLLETGANDVLVVDADGRETLVPFVTGEVIKDVDLAKGEIRVDWEWD